MIDKEKYPNLHHAAERNIKMRTEWLQEAVKAQVLCDLLPETIKELEITSVNYSPYGDTLNLSIKNTDGTVRLLKELGIQSLRPKVSSWSKTHFYSEGEGVLSNGSKLSITVSNIEEPEGCEIKKKRSWSTEYVLVCPQSGEELK